MPDERQAFLLFRFIKHIPSYFCMNQLWLFLHSPGKGQFSLICFILSHN